MAPQLLQIAALTLTALGLAPGAAHLMELPVKLGYPPELYAEVTSTLYAWFGRVGGTVQVAAAVTVAGLAFLVRRKRRVGSRAAERREADPLLAPDSVCDRAAGVRGVRFRPRSRARPRARARCAHIARRVTLAARQRLHATGRGPRGARHSGGELVPRLARLAARRRLRIQPQVGEDP